MKQTKRRLSFLFTALLLFGGFLADPGWARVEMICEGECGGGGGPQTVPYPGWPRPAGSGTPVTADLDGDGTLEVLVGSGSYLYAFRENGDPLWPPKNVTSYWTSAPVAVELDPNIPGLEILIGTGAESSGGTTYGKLYAFHADGNPVAGWPQNLYGAVSSAIVVADLFDDGDGVPEIIVGSRGSHQGHLIFFRPTGIIYWIWDLPYGNPRPAVSDLDRDGALEIILVHNRTLGVYYWYGENFPGWPVDLGDYADSKPAIGDLDGDGDLEIIVGTSDGMLHAFHHTGSPASGWPQPVRNYMGDPVLGDLDGNGTSEVIVGDGGGVLHVFQADGAVVGDWPKPLGNYASQAIVADLNGDLRPEVLAGFANGKLHAFYGEGGSVHGFPLVPNQAMYFAPAVADLNGDGYPEVLMAPGSVFAWTLPWLSKQRTPWPMERKNRYATGSNIPPLLDPIGDKTVRAEAVLTFQIHAEDPDDEPLIYSAASLPAGATFDSESRTFSWLPRRFQAGVYEVTFTVTDAWGDAGSEKIRISVVKKPPKQLPDVE